MATLFPTPATLMARLAAVVAEARLGTKMALALMALSATAVVKVKTLLIAGHLVVVVAWVPLGYL